MIQGIAKGAPCKEINPAIISKHFRKYEIISKKSVSVSWPSQAY